VLRSQELHNRRAVQTAGSKVNARDIKIVSTRRITNDHTRTPRTGAGPCGPSTRNPCPDRCQVTGAGKRLPPATAHEAARKAAQNELFAARRSLKMAQDAKDEQWVKGADPGRGRARHAFPFGCKVMSKHKGVTTKMRVQRALESRAAGTLLVRGWHICKRGPLFGWAAVHSTGTEYLGHSIEAAARKLGLGEAK
jgi:hypothetical protein